MDDSLVDRLRDESLALQKHAWSRMDGGQECSLSANLADEAANVITALEGAAKYALDVIGSTNRFDAEQCKAAADKLSDALSLLRGGDNG